MVKLKKQVAINKISHFFENTQLVIFFHCTNQKYFYDKVRKLLSVKKACLSKKDLESFLMVKQNNQELPFIEKDCNESEGAIFNNIIIKLIKNNYAKQVLIRKTFSKKNKNFFKNDSLPRNDVQSIVHPRSVSTSLFHGNNLLIGFKNIKTLHQTLLLKEFIDDENINLLGGIYENSIINHYQVLRLAQICEDKQIYQRLNSRLQEKSFALVSHLKEPLSFDYLLKPHLKIIALLKLLFSSKKAIVEKPL